MRAFKTRSILEFSPFQNLRKKKYVKEIEMKKGTAKKFLKHKKPSSIADIIKRNDPYSTNNNY